ncbi:MAG: RnfABCDGE type electron transport complex subunit G [Clostridia bacterium]|nr:RnfABCDGE type electron transport complex subunit G [Clostridia bacterium]
MRDIVKPALILFMICVVVSVSLAFTYSTTKNQINAREIQAAEAARKEALSAADSFEKIDGIKGIASGKPELETVKEVYKGLKGTELQGYVFTVEPKGYGGPIHITVGIDTKGKLCGIKIGQNNETPGLGTKAAEPAFMSQLTGIVPKEPLKVVKGKKSKPEEVEAVSGATITSKAVVGAAQAAVDIALKIAEKEGGVK